MKLLLTITLAALLANSVAAITADELEKLKAKAPVHPVVMSEGVNAPPQSRDLFRKYVRYVRMIKPDNAAAARARLTQWVDEDIAKQDQILSTSSPQSTATRHQYYVAKADKDWLGKFRAWVQRLPAN